MLRMSDYFSRYCTLINSPVQLGLCRQMQSLGELLACIKNAWNCHSLSDDELLGEIHRLNQIALNSSDVLLAGNWLPYRYQPKQRLVHWLMPDGHATDPFQDEYISRCCQRLVNQIIQPRSTLAFAQQQANHLPLAQPAGFIFHLSRCGSTLISGCLSELESTCVFSESPLLTELLLDNQLSGDEQKIHLRAFINLQAAAFPNRPQMIIKWNAWDIFRWDLIRTLYPNTPTIFLVRDPVEILASHQKSAGRHMAGDATLAGFHPVFSCVATQPPAHHGYSRACNSPLLDQQTRILQSMLQAMVDNVGTANVHVLDYSQLTANKLVSVVDFFGCSTDKLGFLKMQDRLQFHSKQTGQLFIADSIKKQQAFDGQEQQDIRALLMPTYNRLLGVALKPLKEVIDV